MELKFFARISGENEELAEAELRAVLESEEIRYRILDKLPQVLLFSSTPKCLRAILRRCSMTRTGGPLLFVCRNEIKRIFDAIEDFQLDRLVSAHGTFSVRIGRIQGSSRHIDRETLEAEIGRLILQKRTSLKVDLENPEYPFLGLLTGERMMFGLKKIEINPKDFESRRPTKRPFFHPSSMSPKLARVISNLSRCKEGGLLLDPFCGTGGILLEAGLTGMRVLGSDVKTEMVEGTLRNLRHHRVEPEGLVVSEIGHLPFRKADSIATDAPYGKLSTTLGDRPELIIEKFLDSASSIILKGKYVCLGSKIEIALRDMVEEAGFRMIENVQVKEHRSLTRIVAVLRREE